MKKALFIDRDGTIIVEPPITEQVNTLNELQFLPGVMRALYFLRQHTDFEFVIVSNQDGLGTSAYPQEVFDIVQAKMLEILQGEGIVFDDILIDKSRKEDNLPTRKPGTAMLTKYMSGDYDLSASFVIGDRDTDLQLAKNLGCRGLKLGGDMNWDKACQLIYAGERKAEVRRTTSETDVHVMINLDGNGSCDISTGLGFFDHMLAQISRHGNLDLTIKVKGDLNVDEHHTIEDTALALGEALRKALGDKRGIGRYGFCLPMDDCLCQVAMDLGGRPWLIWNASFKREKIGEMPTEMFLHFFKSLSDSAMMNLNIKAEGDNEHHKIEGIFKAFARSLQMAVKRDINHFELPSTKGII